MRGQLRRIAARDHAAGASGSGVYMLDVADTYELSEADFPSGQNIDDKYDWFGCLCYDDLAQDGDSLVIWARGVRGDRQQGSTRPLPSLQFCAAYAPHRS